MEKRKNKALEVIKIIVRIVAIAISVWIVVDYISCLMISGMHFSHDKAVVYLGKVVDIQADEEDGITNITVSSIPSGEDVTVRNTEASTESDQELISNDVNALNIGDIIPYAEITDRDGTVEYTDLATGATQLMSSTAESYHTVLYLLYIAEQVMAIAIFIVFWKKRKGIFTTILTGILAVEMVSSIIEIPVDEPLFIYIYRAAEEFSTDESSDALYKLDAVEAKVTEEYSDDIEYCFTNYVNYEFDYNGEHYNKACRSLLTSANYDETCTIYIVNGDTDLVVDGTDIDGFKEAVRLMIVIRLSVAAVSLLGIIIINVVIPKIKRKRQRRLMEGHDGTTGIQPTELQSELQSTEL